MPDPIHKVTPLQDGKPQQPATQDETVSFSAGSGTAPFGFIIADHTLLKRIGSGAYGQVFLAKSALGTLRAVKVVSRKALKNQRAFERELRGIRKFEPISRSHPAFLNILHVGQDQADEYFYSVMELGDCMVLGSPLELESYESKTLERVLRSQKSGLSVGEVLRLGISLSDALRHLHNEGLVHRDIKPGNILFVGGNPKLADPGLVTTQIDAKTIVGTVGYIPPEGPGTSQADLFALGKVIYESLTGLDRTNFPDLPSHLDQQPDPKRFLELNQIVLKACHGPAAERYATAHELHGDLVAVQEGRSFSLLRDLRSQFRKWKLRMTVGAAAAAVIAACGWAAYRDAAHRRVERERTIATWLGTSVRATDEGDYISALGNLAEVVGANGGDKDESINRLRFSTTLGQIPKLTLVAAQGSAVGWCGFAPDDRKLLVGLDNGRALVLDVESGVKLVEFVGHTNGIQAAAISSNGTLVATGGRDFTARSWDAGSGAQKQVFVHGGIVTGMQFHPTEEVLVTACADGRVRWWNTTDGQLRREVKAHVDRATCIAVSHDGQFVVSGGRDRKTRMWRADGQPMGEPFLHKDWVLQVALSSDDKRLLVTCADKSAYVWDLGTRTRIGPPLQHDRGVSGGGFSPSDRLIMTFGWDGSLRLWDAGSGARQDPVIPHNSPLIGGGFSHDGARIVTGGMDGLIRVWDFAGRNVPERLLASLMSRDGKHSARKNHSTLEVFSNRSLNEPVHHFEVDGISSPLAISDGGTIVAVLSTNTSSLGLTLWDAVAGQKIGETIKMSRAPVGCSFIHGLRWLSFWESNSIHLVDVGAGESRTIQIPEPIRGVACSEDGDILAVAAGTNVYLRSLPGGEILFAPLSHSMNVEQVTFDPSSKFIVACTSDRTTDAGYAQVWSVLSGQAVGAKLWHSDGVKAATWFSDGKRLGTASEDGTARIWDLRSGQQIGAEVKHREQAVDIDLFGENLLLTAGRDACVRISDASSGLAAR